jgi:FlaA1/EpsC-like NDP-sugar epimerase
MLFKEIQGRDSMALPEVRSFYEGKVILVTGGAGSIGSKVVRKVLNFGPKAVRVFDVDETRLFDLEQDLGSPRVRVLVGDVADRNRLERAVEEVDVVIHAAALKHVPLCEYNPFEAVKVNVLGTQNLIDVSMDEEVEKFITISTDKAVNPINVMGATKLLAEKMTLCANFYKGSRKTAFSSVRFGNVLGSRGSAVSVFCSQISRGGPITVTDPGMTRFVMSVERAAELVLRAGALAKGGETFILKMEALRIVDLAEVMIEEFSGTYGRDPQTLNLQFTGKRSGEKLYEELMTEDEAQCAHEVSDMFLIPSILEDEGDGTGTARGEGQYRSNQVSLLSKDEIRELVRRHVSCSHR